MNLQNGAKIAVVGGGPAGSFFACHILSFARRLGEKCNVVIYDGKSFAKHVPAGCNICAGTLSSNILDLLKKAGYRLPDNVVRQDITGYTLHFKSKSVMLSLEKEGRIVTVYCGMEPCPVYRYKVNFDQYEAVSRGAQLINSKVTNIEFGTITPKMDHIVINIAGKNITSLDMDRFLRQKQVKALLPKINFDGLEYFKGKFPISGAQRNPWDNRFAAAGDVIGWMMSFKGKGVNTAVYTGIKAAKAIMQWGISRRDFIYYEKVCKKLTEDYRYRFIAHSVSRVCRASSLFDP